ncbi:unnamed protein product [Closterium sp. NIES-53]
MYLMTCTRPELAYALSLLARYVAPGQEGRGGGGGGGRGRGRGGRGGRRGGAAKMKNDDNVRDTRDDRFPGQFFFVSTEAPAGPENVEGFEEPAAVVKVTLHSLDYWVINSSAAYSMIPRADLLPELEPSPLKHVTSALGQQTEVRGMGKAMFKGAHGKMVGIKNVFWVPNLAANQISVWPLQKAGMDTSSKWAKTYTARLGERILWDLHEDRDIYNEMWQILVIPMPKERQVAASVSTKGEAVGSGDGANGRAMENESNNYGECAWLTLHRRMGHVALPMLQQLVKNEMVAVMRVKGEPDEVLGYLTCMQAKFTRFLFSSSEATAKAPLDEVVMDVVGPLKLGAAGAEYFLTIVDVYTHLSWVYVLSKKNDVAETEGWLLWDPFTKMFLVSRDCKFMENLMYKYWKAENEAKIGVRFGEVKSSGLEHVELPLELSSDSTITRQSPIVNGGEEAKNGEEQVEEVQQVSVRAPTLLPRNTSPPRIRITLQQLHASLQAPASEEEGRGNKRVQTPNKLTYEAQGRPAKSALSGAALMVGDDEEFEYGKCALMFFSPVEMPGNHQLSRRHWEVMMLRSGRRQWRAS